MTYYITLIDSKLWLRPNVIFSTSSGLDSVGNFRTPYASKNTSWPDVTINFLSLHVNSDAGLIYRRGLNMKSEYFEQFSSLKFKEGFSLIMSLLHPFSRGFIKLRSRDPFAPPLIFPKFFSDPRDMKAIIDGIKKSIRLVTHSQAFRKLGTKFFDKPNPACFPKFTPFSDDYWDCIGKFT